MLDRVPLVLLDKWVCRELLRYNPENAISSVGTFLVSTLSRIPVLKRENEAG